MTLNLIEIHVTIINNSCLTEPAQPPELRHMAAILLIILNILLIIIESHTILSSLTSILLRPAKNPIVYNLFFYNQPNEEISF